MKVELTKEQIKAILHACSNTTDHPDVMASVFNGNRREINTCIRGMNKLKQAIGRSQDGEWSEKDLAYNESL